MVLGIKKDLSGMEEEMEFQVKGKDTKYSHRRETVWNLESEVLDSSPIICFCENIKS